ncbi:MAG: zinc-ribbon domain-containing protein [Oscillospiraceae bacterium]|nr:zinc-ribbon domain-containing protein [Oscillospiraceae bacterium]
MAFCTNCGAPLKEGQKFCTNCGTPAPVPFGNELTGDTGSAAAVQAAEEQNTESFYAEARIDEERNTGSFYAEFQTGTDRNGENATSSVQTGEYRSPEGPAPQSPVPQAPAAPPLGDRITQLNDTPDSTSSFRSEDIAQNKAMSILAYLGILAVIPLFAAKDSPFARYHTNQGLVLLVCEFAVWILGKIFSFLGTIGGILAFILAVIGIINALNGRAKELPVIGKVRLLK